MADANSATHLVVVAVSDFDCIGDPNLIFVMIWGLHIGDPRRTLKVLWVCVKYEFEKI